VQVAQGPEPRALLRAAQEDNALEDSHCCVFFFERSKPNNFIIGILRCCL
jgi:hypothetical protein